MQLLFKLQTAYENSSAQEETAAAAAASTHASHLHKHEATDYAALMAIIFSMVKQDYMMQVMNKLPVVPYFWSYVCLHSLTMMLVLI